VLELRAQRSTPFARLRQDIKLGLYLCDSLVLNVERPLKFLDTRIQLCKACWQHRPPHVPSHCVEGRGPIWVRALQKAPPAYGRAPFPTVLFSTREHLPVTGSKFDRH